MGFLANIGKKLVGGSIGGIVSTLTEAADTFIQTPDERSKFKAQLLSMQGVVNAKEAESRSLFVAGWRPSIGWVCSISLGLYFIPQFAIGAYVWLKLCMMILDKIGTVGYVFTSLPPYPVNAEFLMELVLGMLGLAVVRTVEKRMKVTV